MGHFNINCSYILQGLLKAKVMAVQVSQLDVLSVYILVLSVT